MVEGAKCADKYEQMLQIQILHAVLSVDLMPILAGSQA